MKIRESGLPFDDFRALLKQLPSQDDAALQLTAGQVNERIGEMESVLGDLCQWYAAWSGRSPAVNRPVLTVFAGTHGVDSSNDQKMLKDVEEISSGSSSINRVCHQHDLGLKILDLALQIPVSDITEEPALDEKSCAGTIAFGMEAIAGGTDLLCVSALEYESNISVLSILSVLWRLNVDESSETYTSEFSSKIQEASKFAKPHAADPLEVLRRLGGRETAAICGAILAARSQHIPVLLSGPTAITAALVLERSQGHSTDHCMVAQSTGDKQIDAIANEAGLKFVTKDFLSPKPAIQAAIAAGLVKTACRAFLKES